MHVQLIKRLETLDFSGKGEAFVESMYITPLLACLGYDAHRDYEVIRHGDDGSSFKLKYPPVEKGAVRVKHYTPDYIPTIRKKAFWIIEAKSPKDIADPLDYQYVVQGLQYCIHPEIQAKYLLISNGTVSAVYDAHGAVFLEKDVYQPVLEFQCSELSQRWSAIYDLLSVEKLRTRIEMDVKAMYDKLSLSSLDKNYPSQLLGSIGASEREHSRNIEKHVFALQAEGMSREKAKWCQKMSELTAAEIFARMDNPLPGGTSEAQYFVQKSLAEGKRPADILSQLVSGFERQCIFRKEQTFVAVCALHQQTGDATTREAARSFLDKYKDVDLPLVNQVECAFLRITRKISILTLYPELRTRISNALQSAPELVRFVQSPSPLQMSYAAELQMHWAMFQQFSRLPEDKLPPLLDGLLSAEARIDPEFKSARSKQAGSEIQLCGFEYYGLGGRHYPFRNIMHNLGIERRPDLASHRP
jgi:predicted type IV restriction endonuclease